MQLHPGWVGVLQRQYLNSLGCLWFNRTQASGGSIVVVRGSMPPGIAAAVRELLVSQPVPACLPACASMLLV
jgi:hypothetical protein